MGMITYESNKFHHEDHEGHEENRPQILRDLRVLRG